MVELCDSIQAQRVELANFELFSSPLKSVSISVSNRFPTRDWTFAGQFEAKSERDIQLFDLSSTLFGKFVRVDLTYTNSEHFCPISGKSQNLFSLLMFLIFLLSILVFRVFGTSEIEAFEVENEATNEVNNVDEGEDFEHPTKDKIVVNKDNLLNRAGAAVMSIVQKAAEVLVKSNGNGTKVNATNSESFRRGCMSLSHSILCQHCSSTERNELDQFISCKSFALSKLLQNIHGVRSHLVNSNICNNILGFALTTTELETRRNFLTSIMAPKYIIALCNIIAGDQKVLPLRLEDIPGIHSSLISKKDQVSLKNVSKKETPPEDEALCKQDFYPPPLESTNLNLTAANNTTSLEEAISEEKTNDQRNDSLTAGDELNIFNVIESHHNLKQQDPPSTDAEKPVQSDKEQPILASPEDRHIEEKHEIVVEMPVAIPVETSEEKNIQQETKAVPDVKPQPPEFRTEQFEVKINGDVRSSNPPESVFLRLSNRIKTLEKNMTLSTQYLEELSRRYKKQIEELQQSFSKVQALLEDHNQKKRENEKRDVDDRHRLHDDVVDLKQKAQYMEVILIIMGAFALVQMIIVIMLLSKSSAPDKPHQEKMQVTPPPSPAQVNVEKGRSTARKRSKQRTRKISAPNILTQRSPIKSDFTQVTPVLSRTVSAPNKFNSVTLQLGDNKENYDDMQIMLEENDDILIPGFDDLQINDNESVQSRDLDTASTASALSHNDNHDKSNSNASFKFKRRLSSPFQLKKSSLKKSSSDRSNPTWEKKAMSESPPRIINENFNEIHKSKSFQEDDEGSIKFKKSNSFKKLFKKLF